MLGVLERGVVKDGMLERWREVPEEVLWGAGSRGVGSEGGW